MNARDELMLDSMGATPTGFEIKTHAGGPETAKTLLFIADAMRDALDGHEAPNYLEMEVKASDGKRYIMTLQRAGKITPHQARVNAEKALASARPRTITTVEELDALPEGSVIRDKFNDVSERRDGYWCGYETAPLSDRLVKKYLPAIVLYEPEQP